MAFEQLNLFSEKRNRPKESPTYSSWRSMIKRCTNPKHDNWRYYGGRGISVCKRWRSFAAFLEDMGERPKDKTLDRVDGNGNYCPENCRWATRKEQQGNTSYVRRITFHGKTQILADWSRELGIEYQILQKRLTAGWSVEDAFLRPIDHRYNAHAVKT